MEIEKVSTCFVDDDFTYVDVYFKDEEEGKTVAFIDNITGRVLYKDNSYRTEPKVTEAILDVLKNLSITEKTKKYMENPGVCPFCGDEENIQTDDIDYISNTETVSKLHCNSCGGFWKEYFKMVGVEF
jgi:formate dehydrogenase maturation protein FdhE